MRKGRKYSSPKSESASRNDRPESVGSNWRVAEIADSMLFSASLNELNSCVALNVGTIPSRVRVNRGSLSKSRSLVNE
jgi:hypothetical protein